MRRVLLVDDGPGDVELVRLAVEQAPFPLALDVAADGGSALARLDGGPAPDLVLLDLSLPGTSGLDILRRIRARGQPGPVVVVMSTTSRPDEVSAAYAAGANAFLVKPLELQPFVDQMAVLWRFWFQVAALP